MFDLLEKIRGTFDDPEFSDCEIQVENRVFKVNTMILKLNSDVFRSYFRHDSVEKKTGIIKIEESTANLVELMLRFMYSGEVQCSENDAYLLFFLADRYNVVELMKYCARRMCNSLQIDNIINCLEIAYYLNFDEIKQKCLQFVADNEEEVQQQPEWIQLTDSEHQIARDLCKILTARLRHSKSEPQTKGKPGPSRHQLNDILIENQVNHLHNLLRRLNEHTNRFNYLQNVVASNSQANRRNHPPLIDLEPEVIELGEQDDIIPIENLNGPAQPPAHQQQVIQPLIRQEPVQQPVPPPVQPQQENVVNRDQPVVVRRAGRGRPRIHPRPGEGHAQPDAIRAQNNRMQIVALRNNEADNQEMDRPRALRPRRRRDQE